MCRRVDRDVGAHVSKENGNADGVESTQPELVDTVILTYNRATDHLTVGGKCSSLDCVLDMLHRATRLHEHKWRLERMAEYQKQAAEIARTQAILESMGNKR